MPQLGCFVQRAAARSLDSNVTSLDDAGSLFQPTRPLYCDYCARPLSSEAMRGLHVAGSPLCQIAERLTLQMDSGGANAPITAPPHEQARRDGSPENHAPDGAHDEPQRRDGQRRRGCGVFIKDYPDPSAGAPISPARKDEPDVEAYMHSCGNLADPAKFEVAELLLTTGMTDDAKNRHLQSKMVSDHIPIEGKELTHLLKYKGKPEVPWPNVGSMHADVDKLRHGPSWEMRENEIKAGGSHRVAYLFARNVIEVIKDIIGNTRLKSHMHFAPQRHWTEKEGGERVIAEMWSADWWWRMQGNLGLKNATIAALIVATDQTELSVMCGGQHAYPVYMSMGNINKSIRRKPNEQAMVLIGYLPVESFDDIPSVVGCQRLKGQLIHRAMESIMAPLKEASATGVDMWCADGRLQRVFPILASFIGDWPEQCLMACVKQSSCPVCCATHRNRGDYEQVPPLRRAEGTLESLRLYLEHDDARELDERHLKPWWPWWADLPHVNFHACVTPDLLHQLWQGMFKTHMKAWAEFMVGEKILDERFMSMPTAEGLRHFSSGISSVSQWTGRESKEMAKQLLPAVAGTLDGEVTDLLRAGLEFMFRAHATSMTETDIQEMEDALAVFHRLKHRMVSEGYYANLEHFNIIPKFHMSTHYGRSTRELGTPNGFNSEGPEHLHIRYAKEPWRKSNKVQPQPQMIKHIQRLEAIRIHRSRINEYYGIGQTLVRGDNVGGFGGASGMAESVGEEGEELHGMGEDNVKMREGSEAIMDQVVYPTPRVKIAKTPTKAKTRRTTPSAKY